MSDIVDELLTLNRRLLDAVMGGDWKTYAELCHDSLTCFEPETLGHLVEGLEFHRYYFDLPSGSPSANPIHVTMCTPHVRLLGPDAAVICYVRLTQKLTQDGPVTTRVNETRLWQRIGGRWQHVHFHRSPA